MASPALVFTVLSETEALTEKDGKGPWLLFRIVISGCSSFNSFLPWRRFKTGPLVLKISFRSGPRKLHTTSVRDVILILQIGRASKQPGKEASW